MAKTRIRWNPGVFGRIRTLPPVMAELNTMANDIATRANAELRILRGSNGDGYVAEPAAPTGGRVRGRAAVVTGDISAIVDQARNHTLERMV